jgi:hypothetical protein
MQVATDCRNPRLEGILLTCVLRGASWRNLAQSNKENRCFLGPDAVLDWQIITDDSEESTVFVFTILPRRVSSTLKMGAATTSEIWETAYQTPRRNISDGYKQLVDNIWPGPPGTGGAAVEEKVMILVCNHFRSLLSSLLLLLLLFVGWDWVPRYLLKSLGI